MIDTSVYKYFDEYDVLIYVGITSRGMRRNKEHNTTKDWWQYVGRQEVEHFPSRQEALAREAELIWLHKPPFNIQQNPHHEAMMSAYSQFRASVVPLGKNSNLLESVGRQITLLPVGESADDKGGRVVELSTEPKYAQAAMSMMLDVKTPAMSGTHRVGQVTGLRSVGPAAVLTVSLRKGIEVMDPFARLKIQPGKTPRIVIRNIQVAAVNP